MNLDYILNVDMKFSKLNEDKQNGFNNHKLIKENTDKNNDDVNYNIINNRPIVKRRSSIILKSPKKELFESTEKKILGDINCLIKSKFKNPKIEDNYSQLFFSNMIIPANVKLNLTNLNFSFISNRMLITISINSLKNLSMCLNSIMIAKKMDFILQCFIFIKDTKWNL